MILMPIYLDHNSTTPMLPEVVAAMDECAASTYANAASQHQAGRQARKRLEQAREEVARILGASVEGRAPDRVIFTSGGTEGNNLALLGMADAAEALRTPPYQAIVSAIEHPSVMGGAEELERRGWQIHRLKVDAHGIVRLEHLDELLADRPCFVSVMLGNNETGVLQPVQEIARLCRAAAVPLHTDAVQVAGKLPLSFRSLGVDAMTVTAHKFHGPLGIGALIVRHDLNLRPRMFGGFQQAGLRPGTEPVALAVGMQTALQVSERDGVDRATRMRNLRDRFEATLSSGYAGLVVNGCAAERLPGTSNVAFQGLDRKELFLALDLAGIFCSTGSACASGSSEPSHVLIAMGLGAEIVGSSLRFSLGATTTEVEIDDAAQRILEVCAKMKGKTRNSGVG